MTEQFDIKIMDALEFLRSLPDESVDLIVTDPQYETTMKWRKIGTPRLDIDMTRTVPNDKLRPVLDECARVLKKNSHLYMHCDEETRDILKPKIIEAGFKFWKSLVWDKGSIGMGYHWRGTYEFIVFAEKGKRMLNNLGLPDIFRVKRLKGPQYFPMQKPVELAASIIENSSNPGDVVCDPFMCSGTVGVAAIKLGRKFIGCEVGAKAYERATERLNKAVKKKKKTAAAAVVEGDTVNPGRSVSFAPPEDDVRDNSEAAL